MNTPKVSVVLPVYNGEKYLAESIESVICQTFKEWELIIVDDCSTDSSLNIAKSYSDTDKRITVIHNELNKKLPESLNVGFRQAKGAYLTWTSDDNIFRPNALEELSKYMDEHKDCPLVTADMDFIDADGNFLYEWKGFPNSNMYYNDCVGACFMYRREVLDTVGEYDPEWFCIEDYEYWLRILKYYGYIGYLHKNLYRYRTHNESLTVTHRDRVRGQLCKYRMENLDWLTYHLKEDEDHLLSMYLEIEEVRGFDENLKTYFMKYLPYLENEVDLNKSCKLAVWGCGTVGKKLAEAVPNAINCYIDSDLKKQKEGFLGKEVIPPDKLTTLGQEYEIVIAAGGKNFREIVESLKINKIMNFLTAGNVIYIYAK